MRAASDMATWATVPLPTLPLATLAFDTPSLRIAKKSLELARRHEAITRYIRGATPPPYRQRI